MIPALAVIALAAIVAVYRRDAGPVRPVRLDEVRGEVTRLGRLQLSTSRRLMANLIRRIFEEEGLGWLARAAIANAWHESLLDPTAVGDAGRSVGLFQLHERGAGIGMSVEERKDPRTNTLRIIQEAKARGADAQRGNTELELVAWFAREVERCAACGHQAGSSQLIARAVTLGRLYGAGALLEVP